MPLKRSLHIGPEPIDESALVAARTASGGIGAALYFSGLVRGTEESSAIQGIDYEAFHAMASHQFHKLFDTLEQRWPMVESIRLVHRTGMVRVGESSLWLEILTPHRAEGFAAGQWVIDEMKRVVPIWKRPMA
jgi:molybdopterin synthase catalytic subunit